MTFKSALQDLRETTLAAVSGLLARLAYLASLRRREGGYLHWGMALVHGQEASERALKTAHVEALSEVLRTPVSNLVEDLREASAERQITPAAYINSLRVQGTDLLPSEQDAASTHHLNSILVALSSLGKPRVEKTRKHSTPSVS